MKSKKISILTKTREINKLKLITDNIEDQVIITDPEGTVVYANGATEKNTGFRPDEIIGRSLAETGLWGGLMSREFKENLWTTIQEGKKPFSGEIINQKKSGVKYISELRIFPFLDSKNRILSFIGIETNITKKKELNRVKAEFISLASHQLRTPLTSISLAIDLLLRRAGQSLKKEEREALKEIYEDVHQMAYLISTLLDVSKIQLGTFAVESQVTDIIGVIEDSLGQVKNQIAQKYLKIKKHFGKTIPQIITDKNIVRVVVQNLISNAIKYTPDSGLISFKVVNQKDSLLISVQDSGFGIPESQQAKIFTKFFRADNVTGREAQGTGLGLYLSKVLLEAVGGKIWFKSRENKGTTFYFSLPRER